MYYNLEGDTSLTQGTRIYKIIQSEFWVLYRQDHLHNSEVKPYNAQVVALNEIIQA